VAVDLKAVGGPAGIGGGGSGLYIELIIGRGGGGGVEKRGRERKVPLAKGCYHRDTQSSL